MVEDGEGAMGSETRPDVDMQNKGTRLDRDSKEQEHCLGGMVADPCVSMEPFASSVCVTGARIFRTSGSYVHAVSTHTLTSLFLPSLIHTSTRTGACGGAMVPWVADKEVVQRRLSPDPCQDCAL